MSHKDTKTKYRNSVWLTVAILLILLIVSFILLGIFLQQRSARDINVIALTGEDVGDVSDGQDDTSGEADSDKEGTSDDSEGITSSDTQQSNDTVTTYETVREHIESKVPADEAPGMLTQDQEVQWETSTSVDLFKTAYANENGEITVVSSDGDKLIAPGTSNTYTFTLKNTGNISLDYTLNLSGVFQIENTYIPIQVRLHRGGTWLVGDDGTWEDTASLENLAEKGTLGVSRYVSYTLEWRWPFENDEEDMRIITDMFDTMIGNTAVTQNVDFELNIATEAEVTPGAVPTDADGNPIYRTIVETVEKLIPVEPEVPTDVSITEEPENTDNQHPDSDSDPNIPEKGHWGLIGLLLGALWCIFLIFIIWRRKIYITGFATSGHTMKLRRAESEIENGRFVFARARFGKSILCALDEDGNEISDLEIHIKRDRDVQGMKYEDGKLLIGKKVIAVEIYVDSSAEDLVINPDEWAAIDKDHNVITPDGLEEPENGCNRTPGGLYIDKHNNLMVNKNECQGKK